MNPTPARCLRWFALLALLVGLLVVCASPALAGPPDPTKTASKADADFFPNLILYFVAVVILWLGVGASMATMRVIVPGIATRADRAVNGLGVGRLFVSGILPLVGASLIAMAVGQMRSPVLNTIVVLAVVIPLFLALLVGAMAALPHLGSRLLKDGADAGLLKQCVIGGGVIGLAGATWVVPPLGMFLTFVVAGWLVGIGTLAAFPGRPAPDPEAAETAKPDAEA